jgi:prephenate dehydratase
MARIGYLGPPGTFSEEALRSTVPAEDAELVALATIHDTVMAVQDRRVDSALVPIENSLEGSVDVTLDALAIEAGDVSIVGEIVRPIRNCLIASSELELAAIETVHSHPQAIAQCARFLRTQLPQAKVIAASSTADAVRTVAERRALPEAALGNRLAAELYRCIVLREDVEDEHGNETRFVWIERRDGGGAGARVAASRDGSSAAAGGPPMKTSIVFWGAGDEAPGWLVRCLSEFASREISLTRIESRPRRLGLGHYMFFADLEGGDIQLAVSEAIAGLRAHCEEVRVLGSYPTG